MTGRGSAPRSGSVDFFNLRSVIPSPQNPTPIGGVFWGCDGCSHGHRDLQKEPHAAPELPKLIVQACATLEPQRS